MGDKMIEFAFIRNKLASDSFNKEDGIMLKMVKDKILISDSPFKEITLNAINNCEEFIRTDQLILAAREIHLIHNFTFNNFTKWNADYFYKIELLSYLEQTEDVSKIKKLILLLAKLQITIDNQDLLKIFKN